MRDQRAKQLVSVIPTSTYGGAHNQALQLCEPLRQLGWNTTVVMPDEPGTALARFRDAKVQVVTLPLHRVRAALSLGLHWSFTRSLRREGLQLRDLFNELDADVVQVHGLTSPHVAVAAHRAGRPIVWQIIDSRAPQILRLAMAPLLMHLADVVMVTGLVVESQYPFLASAGVPVVRFVPPVDSQRFTPSVPILPPNVGGESLVVGTVANRNPQKGLEDLITAFAAARRRFSNIRLQVRGAGTTAHAAYDERLHTLVRDLGLPHDTISAIAVDERVEDVLRGFDVFVLSSVPRSEGIPTAVLEAMATGVPVIATKVGGVPEIVTDRVDGIVVPARQREKLAEAICLLLADAVLRRRLGDAGRVTALTLASTDRCATLHAEAYRQAVARHSGSLTR